MRGSHSCVAISLHSLDTSVSSTSISFSFIRGVSLVRHTHATFGHQTTVSTIVIMETASSQVNRHRFQEQDSLLKDDADDSEEVDTEDSSDDEDDDDHPFDFNTTPNEENGSSSQITMNHSQANSKSYVKHRNQSVVSSSPHQQDQFNNYRDHHQHSSHSRLQNQSFDESDKRPSSD